MNLDRLAAAMSPLREVGVGADGNEGTGVEIEDLAYDTRRVGPRTLFFCVPGSRVDGHDLAQEAVARGAVALVVARRLPVDVPQLVVEDIRRAMPLAAVEFFGDPTRELDVAAVTGTAGKTTTTYLLHAILEAAGRRPGLLTNLERRVGGDRLPADLNTPEAIDLQRLFRGMLEEGNGAVAMEATSIAQVKRRLDGTRFAVLAFTNLSQEHLDFHGTMEDYFEAKRRLFDQAERAVVSVGDAWGQRLADELPGAIRVDPAAPLEVELHLRGDFNRANALLAAASARALGVGEDAIVRGLESVRGVPGRFEEVDEGQPFTVLVDYAHKPGSLETVLRAARGLASGRLICVFGCGGDRDRGKRPVMGRIAAHLADRAILTSDNPRSEDPQAIIDEVLAGAPELEVEPDRRAAIELALAGARDGDVVVIAGKGHEQGQEIAGVVYPFDDRAVTREVLRRIGAAA
jgi:UDP-N-acetylmuramoyl-L-alanyl-D-glutamate--2,6-diaminopimelate ligase